VILPVALIPPRGSQARRKDREYGAPPIEKGKSKLDLDESGHLLGLCLGTLDDYLVVHPEDGHSPAALVAPLAEEDQGELGPRIAVSRISLG
jgi:hypothetical protein